MWPSLQQTFQLPLLLIMVAGIVQGQESATSDDELSSLIAVQVIFRHGAKTIDKTFPSDPYNDKKFWPNGFGQLTCIGKMQCFKLGRFLRQRYSSFMNTTYVRRELYTLSSDVDRTIQSANAVLAGFYPPNKEVQDCVDIPWNDIPIHTLPFAMDSIIRQEAPCPNYQRQLDDFYASTIITDLVASNKEIVSKFLTNANITTFPSIPDLAKFYDALIIERYFNLTLPEWVYEIIDSVKLKELTLFYFQTLSYSYEMKRLRAGPLFNHLLHNFNLTLGDEQGRLFYIFSGHDHTLTTFLDTLHLYPNHARPTFASAVVLELHRKKDSQDLLIKLFYKNETDSERLHRLEIPGCPSPCLYQAFLTLVDPYQLDHARWIHECLAHGERSTIVKATEWTLISLASLMLLVVFVLWVCSTVKKNKTQQQYSSL